MNEMDTFYAQIEKLDNSLKALDPLGCSLVLTLAGFRLLPLYDHFQHTVDGDGTKAVSEILAEVVPYLRKHQTADSSKQAEWRERMEPLVPMSDDFQTIWAAVAQNVAIVIDCSAQIAAEGIAPGEATVAYCLDPLKMLIGFEKHKLLDPGDGPLRDQFWQDVMGDERMRKEIASIQSNLEFAKSLSKQTADAIDKLVAIEVGQKWKADQFSIFE